VSVNAWLVRTVVAALGADAHAARGRSRGASDKNFSGWVR
jgi:hypothetical protein